MFEFLASGGILMIPIFLCGVFATYIIVERWIYFSSIEKRDVELMKNLDMALTKHDYQSAESYCAVGDTPLSSVLKSAVLNRKLREADMREIVQTELDTSISLFEGMLPYLSPIATVATLLGLLGTVMGNIHAFNTLATGGAVETPPALAGAISEALVTTAAGLCVAIPVFIFSSYLNSRVEKNISSMEKFVTNMLLRLTGRIL